ncbi:PTS sugar transporter subunit IIA [Lentisphaera profundi]|uniref:PTS sugar transporter subunit IIA n=1 Tax=Lentisphaera profundi TaxID=1658616 RepID=A0ABY7VT86_9BACT|nr:PTS sugar transporter subunit IIA [Lentisphaera profundi]WDE96041.1 PTS sugar transporter subunit IIA [Lentisphaera profundi]
MPYSILNMNEAADYLHLSINELEKLVNKRSIPFDRSRGQIVFRKIELRDWSNQVMLDSCKKTITAAHKRIDLHLFETPDDNKAFLSKSIFPGCMIPDLAGKTRKKILQTLAQAAFDTSYATDENEIFRLLEEREELCPTGIAGGIAIPHTRVHSPYLYLENMILIGKTDRGIPFGAADHKMTDIFVMPCTVDDRHHLYMLSRIALLFQTTDLANKLREAHSADEMEDALKECEKEIIQPKK